MTEWGSIDGNESKAQEWREKRTSADTNGQISNSISYVWEVLAL